ncbi:MAG: 16S rRNA (adenine(1518)-N(6)/adenine(1519)-N(6))-dimethyltransferase RsmA [Bryobacterales bacterium]|nr:16S rRNA (adenine(1518)-N(6)/adenine(1519)-N(6))-dimethyltransferase RsmA [Bryobacteraceae bacterium]MDW8131567.1 16S rRNA (adenine(1518)-N(6)/adenine(1519)-N(6))-dimethyltransferase RsmA [Bryobacterales bacterium]
MPRKLGQHFLHRQDLLARIAEAACPQTEPLVVEIGAGRGALTEHLLARSQRVVAIEVDPRLAVALEERLGQRTGLEILRQDVLTVDLGRWGAAVVAGNIPYYISSPILERVLGLGPLLKRAVLLLQREVAERVAARPGRREYGLLSVHAQVIAETEILFLVPPSAFRPPPKVESAVLRLEPRPAPLLDWAALPAFLAFAGRCFRFKRRTLRNNLLDLFPRAILDARPQLRLRAEQLSPAELVELYWSLNPLA